MNKLIIILLVIIAAIHKGNANISCYICEDCPDASQLTDSHVQSCNEGNTIPPTITTSTTIRTTSTTTKPTTQSSSSSSSTSSSNPTDSSSSSSTASSTESSSSSSTASPIESSSSSSTSSSTESSSSSSTSSSTESSSSSSTSSSPESEAFSLSSSTTESSTLSSTLLTTPSADNLLNPSVSKSKKLAVLRNLRSLRQDSEYNCLYGQLPADDKKIVIRTCIPKSVTCDALMNSFDITDCRICASDKCNNANGFAYPSIVLMLGLLCIRFFM